MIHLIAQTVHMCDVIARLRLSDFVDSVSACIMIAAHERCLNTSKSMRIIVGKCVCVCVMCLRRCYTYVSEVLLDKCSARLLKKVIHRIMRFFCV